MMMTRQTNQCYIPSTNTDRNMSSSGQQSFIFPFLPQPLVLLFCVIYLLASSMPSSANPLLLSLNKEPHQEQQQQDESIFKDDNHQPLLRFSFAKFLANPCGLMSASAATAATSSVDAQFDQQQHDAAGTATAFSSAENDGDNLRPPPFSSSSTAADQHLSDEAHHFLDPLLRQQYNNINRSLFTAEERTVIIDEYLLVLQEVKYRTKLVHPLNDLHQCNHVQLSSLSDIKQLINQKGEFDVKEIYRALALTAAHLHLMSRDQHLATVAADLLGTGVVVGDEPRQRNYGPSAAAAANSFRRQRLRRRCDTDTDFYKKNIETLIGKVETLMCLTFPMGIGHRSPSSAAGVASAGNDGDDAGGDSNSDWTTSPDQLFQVIHSVLQTNVHHNYRDCSAREMRSCLVVRYAQDVFDVAHQLGLGQPRQLERSREEDYRRKYCSSSSASSSIGRMNELLFMLQ